ncbi:MAG TPA: PAC2 family protein [Ilumatobacteraceae bacterium]|nr:PAC2 family protein [Ilumatobacteraceae bacterium]
MTQPYTLHEELPSLDAPVLVVMLSGWIDASGAAAAAMTVVQEECSVRPLATFDGDSFIDYRARRPTMELREGVNSRLVWSDIELHVGRDAGGHDVLTLSGPEPDAQWRRFAGVVSGLAVEIGVKKMVALGAYPFATPHTRDPRLSTSSPSTDLVASVTYLKNSVDVPAGMGAVLEHAFHEKGVPAIGIWAQVPHYVSAMSYPAATVALLRGLGEVAGVQTDAASVRQEAIIQRQRLDQLVASNDEHQAMVRQLEELYDNQQTSGLIGPGGIPTGDELAAEFEQFLRDQDS